MDCYSCEAVKPEYDVSKDLDKPVTETVRKNQAPATGLHVLFESDGVLSEYVHVDDYPIATRFANRLQAEIDWIERFTSHAPSVGTHYERILTDLVSEYLPSKIKIGTGFVYDSRRELSSPQIDIICYRDDRAAPLYRRGDFVIVQPEQVLLVCEVKKTLTPSDLSKWVRKTVGCNLGTGPFSPSGVQTMAVFAYISKSKPHRLVKSIESAVSGYLKEFHSRTKDGAIVILAVQQLCLPDVYMRDQDLHITTTLTQQADKPYIARAEISVKKAGGPPGVSPFLGLLNSLESHLDSNSRDHMAGHLYELVDTVTLDVPIIPLNRISSDEMQRRFVDAKEILKVNGAYAAIYSSFEDPSKHNSLMAFSRVNRFRWLYAKDAIQQSAPADAEKRGG